MSTWLWTMISSYRAHCTLAFDHWGLTVNGDLRHDLMEVHIIIVVIWFLTSSAEIQQTVLIVIEVHL